MLRLQRVEEDGGEVVHLGDAWLPTVGSLVSLMEKVFLVRLKILTLPLVTKKLSKFDIQSVLTITVITNSRL